MADFVSRCHSWRPARVQYHHIPAATLAPWEERVIAARDRPSLCQGSQRSRQWNELRRGSRRRHSSRDCEQTCATRVEQLILEAPRQPGDYDMESYEQIEMRYLKNAIVVVISATHIEQLILFHPFPVFAFSSSPLVLSPCGRERFAWVPNGHRARCI